MHILIVNDDGIHAPGIRALVSAACAAGHRVTVYAPDSQRSAASHAITLEQPLRAVECNVFGPDVRAFAVNGTPADCAKFGIFLEKENTDFDFVLSGINNGPNRGAATLYSGTVGAAMEASLCGYPAMAVSLCAHEDKNFEISAGLAVRVMEWAAGKPRLKTGEIYNLNVPYTDTMPEVRAAAVSSEYIFNPVYTKQADGSYVFVRGKDLLPYEENGDTTLTKSGYASLSILTWNLQGAMPDISDFEQEV